jgi:hypothetical protein
LIVCFFLYVQRILTSVIYSRFGCAMSGDVALNLKPDAIAFRVAWQLSSLSR